MPETAKPSLKKAGNWGVTVGAKVGRGIQKYGGFGQARRGGKSRGERMGKGLRGVEESFSALRETNVSGREKSKRSRGRL